MHLNFNLPKKILGWYDNNKRSLPWRVGKNSSKKLYYRLLSEFMLQQTQVKTVIPYFKKFTEKFKTLKSLSRCSEKKILKLWEGLGYYRRSRNLLAASKIFLRPGGLIYVEVPDGETAVKTSGTESEEFFIEHFDIYSKKSLGYLINNAGLKILSLQNINEPSGKFTIRGFAKIQESSTLDD